MGIEVVRQIMAENGGQVENGREWAENGFALFASLPTLLVQREIKTYPGEWP